MKINEIVIVPGERIDPNGKTYSKYGYHGYVDGCIRIEGDLSKLYVFRFGAARYVSETVVDREGKKHQGKIELEPIDLGGSIELKEVLKESKLTCYDYEMLYEQLEALGETVRGVPSCEDYSDSRKKVIRAIQGGLPSNLVTLIKETPFNFRYDPGGLSTLPGDTRPRFRNTKLVIESSDLYRIEVKIQTMFL